MLACHCVAVPGKALVERDQQDAQLLALAVVQAREQLRVLLIALNESLSRDCDAVASEHCQ